MWSSTKLLEDALLNPNPIPFFSSVEYDFIVVGAGSAGATVAYRLSENGKFRVLLLEAGGNPSPYNSVPGLAPFNLHLSTDWSYRIVPQKDSCYHVDERRMHWPRGKALGGSSELNFMIYIRGHPKDFDNWAALSEDDGWKYENLLPFFKKSENYHGNFPNPDFHGTSGPLHVSKQSYQPSVEQWVAAGQELGYDTVTDPNSYQKPGFWPVDVTIWQGQRGGTYESFLRSAESRKNLQVYRYAHATKIEIDDSLRATGVTFVRDGTVITATAKKEIVISAGAIETPKLLLLSGIGPRGHLDRQGIRTKVDSPGVGQNLQDHVLTLAGPFLLNESISFIAERNLTLATFAQYAKDRTGPISSNIVAGLGFVSSSIAERDWPDLEFHMSPVGIRHGASEDFTVCLGLKPNVLMEYLSPYLGRDSNFVLLDLGRPKTTGFIELRSKDPFLHPKIDPRYFDHPDDMRAMVDGMQILLKVFEETKAYQSVGAKLVEKKLPGCEEHPAKSDAYFECYIRHLTATIYHPCCTAKFGRDSDPMAVLDSKLRVRGVKGLRVADASVMPQITNGNLNAPTIMIGEKVSDFILKEWNTKK